MDDTKYLERRAEAELQMAERANHPNAVRAHYELANMFLALLNGRRATAEAAGRWLPE